MKLRALKIIPSSVSPIPVGAIFNEFNEAQAMQWIQTGYAEDPSLRMNKRGWDGLKWDDQEVTILASGESLSVNQCEAVNRWRADYPEMRKVIAINTTFKRAPWADVIYACDKLWWDLYYNEVNATCTGELWTQDAQAAKEHGIHWVRSIRANKLAKEPGLISQGENSGLQALGLAYQSAARTVYLLGFDMKGGHWHGDHPDTLNKQNRYDVFLKNFAEFSADVDKTPDFDVFNCTPQSAMKSFPTKKWKEIFTYAPSQLPDTSRPALPSPSF